MLHHILLLSVLCVWLTRTEACKPPPWVYGSGANTTAEYAKNLMKNATTIAVARVVSVEEVVSSGFLASTKAQLQLVEGFKGASNLREVHGETMGICETRKYTRGEERLFVLVAANDKLYEVLAWEQPKFPVEVLVRELRALQPNRTVDPDARKGSARRSP